MEGFWRIRIAPALRRLITRGLALIPALSMLLFLGEDSVMGMLIASQVVLSLQLPFAVVPLIRLTNARAVVGEHANSWRVRVLACACAALIVTANVALIANIIGDLRASTPTVALLLTAAAFASLVLLVIVACVRLNAATSQVSRVLMSLSCKTD